MTDNEDLLGSSTCEIENDVYDILNFETMELLKEENILLKNKLTKYKRAFEILKEELNIQIFYDDECCEPMWVLDGGGNKEITKEEYELLEELMSDGKID